LELSRVFASLLRQRILRELAKTREIRVMKLVHTVNAKYNEVNRNLGILKAEGLIIDEYRIRVKQGTVRIIALNRENPKTKLLLTALKTLDTV
jgi:hypothetical protein